ncbi:MAG: metalloregulator ArsR/SmtB family transcription factor [bacterium]|nr:metalloregulator ArsR/SmtB family transcription factor [bacterium]
MPRVKSDKLDATFAALSDPTRRSILSTLSRGPATVGELAEPFDMSLPAISKHLKVLESAGLIRREKSGRNFNCSLQSDAMQEAAEWIAGYRDFWDRNLRSLDRFLKSSGKSAESRASRKTNATPSGRRTTPAAKKKQTNKSR